MPPTQRDRTRRISGLTYVQNATKLIADRGSRLAREGPTQQFGRSRLVAAAKVHLRQVSLAALGRRKRIEQTERAGLRLPRELNGRKRNAEIAIGAGDALLYLGQKRE
jgi:hypothetical protein